IVAAKGGQVFPLTSGTGPDRRPAWSPDGASVAFESRRDNDIHLWVIPSTGGEARRIGNLPSPERSPVWSADSSHLRALTSMGGRILLVDHTAGEHDDQKTVMMPLLTGIDLASSSFALSREGDRVVYLSGGGSGISLVKFGSSPGVTLFEGGIDTR